MILDIIITGFSQLFQLLLSPLPDLPPMPEAITEGAAWITDTVASVVGFLQVLYTPALLTAMVLVITSILLFDQIYWLVMWVVRKLPFLNIK